MSAPRRIVFMTGTRADFGKLKPLMLAAQQCPDIEVHVFATGMHMNPKYGRTVEEVQKCGFKNVFMYHNHFDYYAMDMILAKTIEGFSFFVKDLRPDLIVLHGDRVETLAGAIVVVYPNNDHGTDLIFAEYTRLEGNPRFRLFPSVRFESFLVLLREADFIMGNSSSGLMEAPYFGVPAINVGSRQQKRARASGVIDCLAESGALLAAMQQCNAFDLKPVHPFGDGRSAEKFVAVLRDEQLWRVEPQKVFYELAA